MVFKPDLTTAFMDHFARYPMLSVISDIYSLEEEGAARFEGDPRYVAQKAERYLQQSGVARQLHPVAEFEFYVLDHISYQVKPQHVEVLMDSEQAAWNTADREYGNLGYKVRSHGGTMRISPMTAASTCATRLSPGCRKAECLSSIITRKTGGPARERSNWASVP